MAADEGSQLAYKYFNQADPWVKNLLTLANSIPEQNELPFELVLLVDDRHRMSIITDKPGGRNISHWHMDFNEVWYVVAGELEWDIGGRHFDAKAGDLVFAPRFHRHLIKTVGTVPSTRLCIASPIALHIAEGWSPVLRIKE